MDMQKKLKKAAEATAWNPMKILSDRGVRSGHAYTAGLIAMGLSCLSWMVSHKNDDPAVRGGLHLGGLATCLLVLGVGLKHEE